MGEIDESLKEHIHTKALIDCFDFEAEKFTNAIFPKKKLKIRSKFPLVKLGEVCEVAIGGTPSRNNRKYFNGKNLWVSVSELNGKEILSTKENITDEAIANSNVKLVQKGSILMSFKLSIGKVAVAGKNLYTNEAIASLTPRDKNVLLKGFIFSYIKIFGKLFSHQKDNNVMGKSLNSKDVKNLKIPLPPLSVQEKIVQMMEALETQEEANITEIIELKKGIDSIIEEAKGHPLVKLGEVCEIKKGTTITESKALRGVYPVIAGGKSSPYSHNKHNAENVITISASGANAGYISYHPTKIWASDCSVISSNFEGLKIEFLKSLLKSMQKIFYLLQRGNAQPHVYPEDLKNLKIPLPPLSVQEKIVSRIEVLEQKIGNLESYQMELKAKKEQTLKQELGIETFED